jgi:hypothetical protein
VREAVLQLSEGNWVVAITKEMGERCRTPGDRPTGGHVMGPVAVMQ